MSQYITAMYYNGALHKPYVDDKGIHAPFAYDGQIFDQCIITREMFVEAYNKWIKNAANNPFVGVDDADDWCDD